MVTIKLKLDKKDHVTYQLYVASNSERIKKKRKTTKFRVPIIYLLCALVLYVFGNLFLSVAFLLIAILWFFIYPIYERRRYVKHYESFVEENFKKELENEATIEFTENEIRTSDAMGNSNILIEKINAVDEIEDYFFIRLTPGMGLILPKRKIKNLNELEIWFEMLKVKYGIDKKVNIAWKWK